MPLRDTLQQIHERQQREEQISQDKPKWITDWKAAVSSLLAKLREYLSEYEGEGTMTFATSRTRLTEESLGTYEVEAMNIKVGPIVLIVQPVGLMVIGAAGRVDMHRQGRATEPRRVILLRTKPSPNVDTFVWVISLPPEPSVETGRYGFMGQTREYVPLTKEVLERAIDFLLK